MWSELAAAVDAFHAALMAAWILGLPLLFWHRWPKISRAYGVYAVFFVLATRLSHYLLGECFLTSMSRHFWSAASGTPETDEWFTVRFARLVFGLTPSHHALAIASEALVFITAVGVLMLLRHQHDRGEAHERGVRQAAAPFGSKLHRSTPSSGSRPSRCSSRY